MRSFTGRAGHQSHRRVRFDFPAELIDVTPQAVVDSDSSPEEFDWDFLEADHDFKAMVLNSEE
jgi:hypothetical protein